MKNKETKKKQIARLRTEARQFAPFSTEYTEWKENLPAADRIAYFGPDGLKIDDTDCEKSMSESYLDACGCTIEDEDEM